MSYLMPVLSFELETHNQTFIGEYHWRIGDEVYKFDVHQERATFPKRIAFNGATYVAEDRFHLSANGNIKIFYRAVRLPATHQVATDDYFVAPTRTSSNLKSNWKKLKITPDNTYFILSPTVNEHIKESSFVTSR